MGTRIITEVFDDIDGTVTEVDTVQFGLDGETYEIDLTDEHARELRDGLARWVEHARKVRAAARQRRSSNTGSRRQAAPTPAPAPASEYSEDLATVRRWAIDNGFKVAERGRLPRMVLNAYRAASDG